ncbi:zygote arrest protein 1 [Macrotis lagotis]|uniref:zygote arrest protein 1 n=1 Tax=Macrotis lagotis TaxID=92651 RepID=UPI003D691C43
MAALADDGLDGYMYPPYGPCSFPYAPGAKAKGSAGGGWRARAGAGAALPGCGLTAAEYLDGYQRAQLMAVLSHMNPGLAPRPRKAGTRDAAVQVNPRRDASVQCSLGRRTLGRRGREPGDPAPPAAPRPARFPRSVAVYSPVVSRRLAAFVEEAEAGDPAGEAPPAGGAPGAAEPPGPGPGPGPQRGEGGEGAPEPRPDGPKDGEPVEEPEEEAEAPRPQSPGQGKARLRFQFLEQKYGYYHCKDCNIRWESAYVWCVQGTNKVYFKQFCRTCQKSYNPYRVEDIACQSCKQTRCSCPVKLRHVDPKRPHRQDLCGRCKGKRLSCDSTFSFKYII